MPAGSGLENGDDVSRAAGSPVLDHVTFRPPPGEVVEPMEAAADLVRHVRAANKARSTPIKLRPHRSYSGAVTVRVSWQGDRFHTIKLVSTPDGGLLASHNVGSHSARGARDLSAMLHDWLTASDRVIDICWRTRDQWKNGAPGLAAPT
jgi:hypothetical protein